MNNILVKLGRVKCLLCVNKPMFILSVIMILICLVSRFIDPSILSSFFIGRVNLEHIMGVFSVFYIAFVFSPLLGCFSEGEIVFSNGLRKSIFFSCVFAVVNFGWEYGQAHCEYIASFYDIQPRGYIQIEQVLADLLGLSTALNFIFFNLNKITKSRLVM